MWNEESYMGCVKRATNTCHGSTVLRTSLVRTPCGVCTSRAVRVCCVCAYALWGGAAPSSLRAGQLLSNVRAHVALGAGARAGATVRATATT
eukprot:5783685-Alexandrium_andersonii.AAC.1